MARDFLFQAKWAKPFVHVFASTALVWSELDTPQPDRFVTESNTSLGQQIFDISVAQVEAVVEPHRVTDNLRWKSVSFVCIHPLIVSQGDLT